MMKRWPAVVLVISTLVALCFISLAEDHPQIKIRFSPDDHVFLAQDNRFIATANFEIQNMAIINNSSEAIKIDEVIVDVFSQNTLVTSNHYSGDPLEKSWRIMRSWMEEPGMMKSEDPRFRFKELLGVRIALAQTTTLAPQTAILISRQFFFAQAVMERSAEGKLKPIWPDQLRATVRGTTAKGEHVTAQGEMRILVAQLQKTYEFPVRGRWYIAASSSVRSHHRLLPVHEFALDVIQIGADGKSYKGDGTHHSNYYAFGKEVYAMADGEVVEAMDTIAETRLRRPNESVAEFRANVLEPFSEKGYIASGGNQIVIKHAEGEYSSYAHLKSGSVVVKKGEHVKQGQLIAKVGISGDGFEPHLHFQLTDGPDMSYSRGLPMIFQNVQPAQFSSTIDSDGHRQLQTGEFIDTTN